MRLQTTWNKIHQQWVVLWMDNWYNKQFTTNPDKNNKSLNATALAVLLLQDAPHYWHGHPRLEELEQRVPVVARMLGITEGNFARILHDLGFASTRRVVQSIRAPLDIICPVPAKRPHWRPLCLSKEKVLERLKLHGQNLPKSASSRPSEKIVFMGDPKTQEPKLQHKSINWTIFIYFQENRLPQKIIYLPKNTLLFSENHDFLFPLPRMLSYENTHEVSILSETSF